ncbi:MAG: beta-phosphoglucomutase [Saprospiraceae bacterium]|nr:beta-phosphoglucomutase [Saprospiraceae bacterium]
MITACIFDLDRVIVDSAKFHYLAWKRLAEHLGVDFSEEDNEHLKGVSRMQSLEYILLKGGIQISNEEKLRLATLKNEWYVESIKHIDTTEILPGGEELLKDLKKNQIKISLGSASKNAIAILNGIGLMSYFDFISDGNSTDKSKPDPEVFLIAAKGMGKLPEECIVVEDSIKGIEAAKVGGFRTLGIGDAEVLSDAEYIVKDLAQVSWEELDHWYNKTKNI